MRAQADRHIRRQAVSMSSPKRGFEVGILMDSAVCRINEMEGYVIRVSVDADAEGEETEHRLRKKQRQPTGKGDIR